MTKTLWVLSDNRRGSVGQAMGVVNFLGDKFNIVEKKVNYTKLSALPNWLRGRSLIGLTGESKKRISAPFPDLVLSISRRTAPIARYIKKKSPNTKLVQLMHPGNAGLDEFDLVIVPEHDKGKKTTPNVHYIVGCPHRITAEYLQKEREKWAAKFADLPRPLTAVIVGGAIKKKPFSADNAAALGTAVKNLKQKIGGSVLITTSRRTGEEAQNIIMDKIKDIPQFTYLWGDTKENPYGGFLACADNIVVTADSVSMCCEATGTGRPIYLFTGKDWLTPKHQRFAKSLTDTGCAILLEDEKSAEFTPRNSLNAAQAVADLIAEL